MSKHISLASLALAKAIKHGFGNRVQTIADCIDAAVPFPHNLIVIGTVAKVQARASFQNLATFDRLQRATHRIGQPLCRQRSVTLSTGAASYIAKPAKL